MRSGTAKPLRLEAVEETVDDFDGEQMAWDAIATERFEVGHAVTQHERMPSQFKPRIVNENAVFGGAARGGATYHAIRPLGRNIQVIFVFHRIQLRSNRELLLSGIVLDATNSLAFYTLLAPPCVAILATFLS